MSEAQDMSPTREGSDQPAGVNGSSVTGGEHLPVLPVRAGEIIHFTPPAAAEADPKPIYDIKVPSIATRAAFRRDALIKCGEYPTDDLLVWALKRGVADAYAEPDPVLARIDSLRLDLEDKTGDERADIMRALSEIEITVEQRDTRYAALRAARAYYLDMLPVLAMIHFCVGWRDVSSNGAAVAFVSGRGLPDALSNLPRAQFMQVSTQILNWMGTTGEHARF